MAEYLTLFIGAVVVNNFVLTKFLGLCIFFGISKNLSASVGMGMAVTSVMTMSSILAWIVYFFVLQPLGLTFLTTIGPKCYLFTQMNMANHTKQLAKWIMSLVGI